MADRAHWDDRYTGAGADGVSWYEAVPELSLELLARAGAGADTSVIDVGGGASPLAAVLNERCWSDVSVLDISPVALDAARRRTAHPERVDWIEADVLSWSPPRTWQVWHDRAVFHFLTDPADRATYRRRLAKGLAPGGHAVIIAFDHDGPTTCSGLPVRRYGPAELAVEFGRELEPVASGRHEHRTPSGAVQPMSWVVLRDPRGSTVAGAEPGPSGAVTSVDP